MDEKRIYELGYLLLPTIPEEAVPGAVANIRGLLEAAKAVVTAEQMPVPIKLAYPMAKLIENRKQKFEAAYFGWLKFELAPENLAALKEELKKSKEILRFLLIKTTKEVKPVRKIWQEVKKEKEKEVAAPLTAMEASEIDKKIEELVEV